MLGVASDFARRDGHIPEGGSPVQCGISEMALFGGAAYKHPWPDPLNSSYSVRLDYMLGIGYNLDITSTLCTNVPAGTRRKFSEGFVAGIW